MNIHLRKLTLEDIDDHYASWFSNDDGHLNYYTSSGRSFTKEVLLDDFNKSIDSGIWIYYLIISSDNEKIGTIKIGPIDKRNRTSDLVCTIGNRKFLGLGLAKKAISLANEIAFNEYDIRRLHGGMFSQNIPSIKAYTGAGWVIEATMKGYYFINGEAQDRVCVACFNPKYF